MGYITRLRKQRETINISANAQALCEEHQINPNQIKGTGRKGQITVTDVKKLIPVAPVNTSPPPSFGEEE